MTDTDWIEIGRIVAPQGLKGEVRVYPSSDFPERFLEPGQRWLQDPKDPEPQPVELIRGRLLAGKGLYVVQLAEVTNRDRAESLRNHLLLVPATERPTIEAGEFYVADLIGLKVFLQASGEEIGTVTDIYEAGNDLLEVTLIPAAEDLPSQSQPERVLVPFVEEIVPTVDLAQGKVEINPPTGLLPSYLAW
jgi:16S rRNA processing protein RimM